MDDITVAMLGVTAAHYVMLAMDAFGAASGCFVKGHECISTETEGRQFKAAGYYSLARQVLQSNKHKDDNDTWL